MCSPSRGLGVGNLRKLFTINAEIKHPKMCIIGSQLLEGRGDGCGFLSTKCLDFGCAKMIIHHDDTTNTTFCSAPHDASVVIKSREARKRRDRRVVVVNKTSSEAASTNKIQQQSPLLSRDQG